MTFKEEFEEYDRELQEFWKQESYEHFLEEVRDYFNNKTSSQDFYCISKIIIPRISKELDINEVVDYCIFNYPDFPSNYKTFINNVMSIVIIPVVNNSKNELPVYAHGFGDSGCDVKADIEHIGTKHLYNAYLEEDHLIINPGGRALIPSGIHTAIPEGYEIQVRDRSGLALKYGVMVTNGIGTIDASYRGDIGVVLTNTGSEQFIVHQGDKIAQFVLMKVHHIEWNPVEELDKTDRGEGGYNSTGI